MSPENLDDGLLYEGDPEIREIVTEILNNLVTVEPRVECEDIPGDFAAGDSRNPVELRGSNATSFTAGDKTIFAQRYRLYIRTEINRLLRREFEF